MKRPAFMFYPGDWQRDTPLRAASVAARGLWIDLLCLMHDGEPYGHAAVAGRGLSDAQAAGAVGLSLREFRKLLAELESLGIPSRTEEGVLYSRRMVRDEAIRNKRAAGGVQSVHHPNTPKPLGYEEGRGEGYPSRGPKRGPSDPPPAVAGAVAGAVSAASQGKSPDNPPPNPPPGPTGADAPGGTVESLRALLNRVGGCSTARATRLVRDLYPVHGDRLLAGAELFVEDRLNKSARDLRYCTKDPVREFYSNAGFWCSEGGPDERQHVRYQREVLGIGAQQ